MTCIYCRTVLAAPVDGRVIECRPSHPGDPCGQAIACRDADACGARQADERARSGTRRISVLAGLMSLTFATLVYLIARAV